MAPEQVFLNGALTVALPTIGKDLRFKEVRVCLIGLSGCPRAWGRANLSFLNTCVSGD